MDVKETKSRVHIDKKTVAVFVLCAFIMLFYLSVLFAPRNVCLEYEMYYVDKTLDDWPGYGGLKYELGTPVYFGSAAANANSLRRGNGWSYREEWFSWTAEENANVYFYVESQLPETVRLNISVGTRICESYDLLVNGHLIKSGMTEENNVIVIEIPRGTFGEDELICVTVRSNGMKRLCDIYETEDTRWVGLQVMEMLITEAE